MTRTTINSGLGDRESEIQSCHILLKDDLFTGKEQQKLFLRKPRYLVY